MRSVWKIMPALCLALLLCGCAGAPKVELPDGRRLPADTEELSAVLTEEQLPVLDSFPALRRADLSGSDCYGGMLAWAQAHPETELLYTVALPGGLTAASGDTELDLSALDAAQAAQALPLLAYLPALERVDFGEAGQGVGPEQVLAFRQAYPDLSLGYRFSLAGQALDLDLQTLDLTGRDGSVLEELTPYLPLLTDLETVDLGSDREERHFSWEEIAALEAACPGVEVRYAFRLYDREFSLTDTEMDLSHIYMTDGGAAVRQVIACMPALTYLDMDSCHVSNEDMAALRDDFPDIKVVWRIWFGGGAYSARTDTERILASIKGYWLTGDQVQDLQYCTDVKYIDLGHNIIDDISFVACMPKLQVAILSINYWGDATPLANCTELEYLEIFNTRVSDLSPLSGLTNLRHLNISFLRRVSDISPLYGLTNLERLWIGCLNPIPDEQIEHIRQLLPDCEINTTTLNPTEEGWRYLENGEMAPRYALLQEQFDHYSYEAYSRP